MDDSVGLDLTPRKPWKSGKATSPAVPQAKPGRRQGTSALASLSDWNTDTATGPLGTSTVTLVEGSSFCISLPNGDVHPAYPHGLFVQDTRVLSGWGLTVNGQVLEPLTAEAKEPYRALFATRVPPAGGKADSGLIVERLREVAAGFQEQITVRNYSPEAAECRILLRVCADFADLFEVKEERIQRRWDESREVTPGSLAIHSSWRSLRKSAVIQAPGAVISPEGVAYNVTVPPHGTWSTVLTVLPSTDGVLSTAAFVHPGKNSASPGDERRRQWAAKIPILEISNPSIQRTLQRSYDDLGSLRIHDPDHPDRNVVAAGAPWFMTVFGRDSLWASQMALPVDPSLALGTLQTLAEHQGTKVDPATEEEPGKILHEVRLDGANREVPAGQSTYYGSVDATPLFVEVLGSVSRWGFAADTIAALLPHADRALDWIRDYGDKDGDGFIEYQRLNNHGLANQGWKDSWDGINFADGTLAEPPIALCEAQAYVYGAYTARAWMAYDAGDTTLAHQLTDAAAELKERFDEQFWIAERGYYAIALDGRKRQVDACASNMGHCLLYGLVDDDKAPRVAERLMSPELFSGWGVRTLASDMGAYNPASYHNGSVWPHDNAIIAAGLLRYGFTTEAQQIATAILEAAEHTGGRLPELFCGFDREHFARPVPYPTACSPQAWTATTPIQLLTSLMRYDTHVSRGGVWMDPVLPESYGNLHITNAPLGDNRVTIDITDSVPSIHGLPGSMTFHRGYRPWMTELIQLSDHRQNEPLPDTPAQTRQSRK